MIRYKVAYKLYKNGKVVAYKLYAGVYIFFVSPQVFKECSNHGLLEDHCVDAALIYEWKSMLGVRGKVTESRIDYALKNSTIDYLKEALEVINEMPEIVSFDYLNKDELLFTVAFNIKTGRVINYERCTEKFELWKSEEPKELLQILDFLCGHIDREYMNSRNLITKIKELQGREASLGPYLNSFWMRLIEDRSLQFKDIVFDFEL